MFNQKGFNLVILILGIAGVMMILIILFQVLMGLSFHFSSPNDSPPEISNTNQLKNGTVKAISNNLETYHNNDYKFTVLNPKADITELTISDPINPGNLLDAVSFSSPNWLITLMMIKNPEKLSLEEWIKKNAANESCGEYCANFNNLYKRTDLNENAGIYSRPEKQEVVIQDFTKPKPTKNIYYLLTPEIIVWTSAEDKKHEYISGTTETFLLSIVRSIQPESTPSATPANN